MFPNWLNIKKIIFWQKLLGTIFYMEASMEPLQICSLCLVVSDKKHAQMDDSCFWLNEYKKFFSFETISPNGTNFNRKPLLKILNKVCSFCQIKKKHVAGIDNFCFWMADNQKKYFHLNFICQKINIWCEESLEGPLTFFTLFQ